jgi:predicted negative regulator of RcsB-dependent stress response
MHLNFHTQFFLATMQAMHATVETTRANKASAQHSNSMASTVKAELTLLIAGLG